MGRQRKFSDLELAQAIREGLSNREICAKFQVSKQALSKRSQALGLQIGKSALLGQAEMIISHALDVRRRFVEISDAVRRSSELLELHLKDGNGKIDKGVMSLYIATKTEERKQLEYLSKVIDDYLKAQHLAKAQEAFLQEIACESPECALRIRRRLGIIYSSGLLFQFDDQA